MTTSGNKTAFSVPRAAALTLALAVAAGVAGTAYTRDAAERVSYACANGERFSAEYHDGHVRLRTGSGILALAGQPAGGTRYSDGNVVLQTKGERAVLQRGAADPVDCRARGTTL